MRRIFNAVKAVCVTSVAAACALFAFSLKSSPVFENGDRYEFYLGVSSSAPVVSSQNPALDKLLLGYTAGESVRYEGDRREELCEKFRAELLFCEEAGGAVNYYCYSPLLGDPVFVNGYAVNLHVAVRGGNTAAGTPLIFGGF